MTQFDPAQQINSCPTCRPLARDTRNASSLDRRHFLQSGAALIAAGTLAGSLPAETSSGSTPESIVKHLYDSLTPGQREKICFAWDHIDKERGLLRTRVANNWQVTEPSVNEDFYSADQQRMIRDIFEGIVHPEWHARYDKQLEDDAGGWGNEQSIAMFGNPKEGKFEFVLTGRHMTLRCDGNSADHVAFGGPIFYGHAADTFNESANHKGNVFWPQAVMANQVYEMLDGKQREAALVATSPREQAVAFQGKNGTFAGIPIRELSKDQQEHAQKVLQTLLEMYRQSDQDEMMACLKNQGGLQDCHLAFYKDSDIGNDSVWDNWRLEGPSFVWYFRGNPHVHVWVNVASEASVETNA